MNTIQLIATEEQRFIESSLFLTQISKKKQILDTQMTSKLLRNKKKEKANEYHNNNNIQYTHLLPYS